MAAAVQPLRAQTSMQAGAGTNLPGWLTRPLSLVDATLTDAQGEVLGQAGGSDGVTTFACNNKSADLWLEARGTGGPFVVMSLA